MKKITLFTIALVLAAQGMLLAQTADLPTGAGTSTDPYQVETLNNLYWITQNSSSWDKYFEQTADIDAATTSGWDGGAGFLPIGNSTMVFTGSYNGQGGTVSGLTINRATTTFVGLFGFAEGGEVKNIGVTTASITGNYFVGGIVGYALNSTEIANCFSSGSVTGTGFVGGIIGSLEDSSTIDKSGSTASVSGNRYVGGIAGRNLTSLTDCYAAGSVSGTNYTGGLAGDGTGTVTNSFYDNQTTGQTTSAGGTGKTTAEMTDIATYTNTATSGLTTAWDFVGEENDDSGILDWWNMDESETINSGYPLPSCFVITETPSGTGTETDPYQIATLNHLYWFTENWSNSHIEQLADIPAYSTAYIRCGLGFKPIADGGYFEGHYNGNGHSIKGLTIINKTEYRSGFIASIYYGTVSDLSIVDADYRNENESGSNFGVLVGENRNGSVARCFVSGTINVNGTAFCGMLVGQNRGTITECGASGTISVTGNGYGLGGLIGNTRTHFIPTEVSNCYSFVDIDGNGQTEYIGGFCSYIYICADDVVFENCYSSGSVTGIDPAYADNIGGFLGKDFDTEDVDFTACFWDTENSGTTDGVGNVDPDPSGVTGKTTAEMKTESTFTDAGWDFVGETTNGINEYWDINAIDNDGYPFLTYITPPVVTTNEISNIGTSTAQCGGDVTNEGESSVTAKGVVWDVNDNPTISSYLGITNDGSGLGSYISNLTGLSEGTTYYVRAYASNSEVTGYGAVKTFTTDMTPPGNALDFDGVDDYVKIPDESAFDFTNAMTIEAWIKVNSFDKEWQAIVAKGHSTWRLQRNVSTNYIAFSTNGLSNVDLAGTTNVNDGEWHHVAGVYDGSMKYLYIDGVLDVSIAATGDINNTSDQVHIAEIDGNTDRDFNGRIDEVRIWSIVRSGGEISANMNTVLQGDETGLVAYYRFDQLAGSYLYDRTANNFHGTLHNMDNSDWVPAGWLNATVITDEVTNIESSTAQCGGDVTDEGGSSVTAKGVVWDVSDNPTISSYLGITNDGSGLGSYISSLTGLSASTLYYVRAYATNSNGTEYGAVKTFTTEMTPPGNALDFDGTDDYVSADAVCPVLDNPDMLTLECWIYPTVGDIQYFLAFNTSDYGNNLQLGILSDGTLKMYDGISNYYGSVLSSDQWYHIALTIDDNDDAIVYLDGESDIVFTTPTRPPTDGRFSIAQEWDPAVTSDFYNGLIDEVRVWDTARSETEISNNMHTVLTGNESGLVAYYRFDQTAGTVLPDRTANELDGTLHNMDDSDWVPSTAPVPYYTMQNGNWENNGSWGTGQNAPVRPWSRAKVKHNIILNSNMELIELTIDTNAVMTISAGDTLVVGK